MVYGTGQRKDSPARNASRPGSRSDVRRGYSYRLITEPASLLVGRLSGSDWEAKPHLSINHRCTHRTLRAEFWTSEFWASDGQTAPYPSLAVRARNGRVADNPLG